MSGEFVARMEDVLDLYHEEYDEEYDPERPVVCFQAVARGREAARQSQAGTDGAL